MSKELEAFNKLVNSKKFDRTTNSYRTFYDLCSGDEEELLDIIKSALEENEKLKAFLSSKGNWLKLGNLEQAAKFNTEEEAVNFIKDHSLKLKDHQIIDIK